MKMTSPHILTANKRNEAEPRASRNNRNFPPTEQGYHTPTLTGGCGTPAKFRRPSFREISSEYFAEEAPRSFAVDAAIFTVLIATAMLPIVNGVRAVATLLQNSGLF